MRSARLIAAYSGSANRCATSRSTCASGANPARGEVEDTAAADGGQLVTVPDQRDPGPDLVGDRQQGTGGVLVEHPGLVDQQQVTATQHRPGAGSRFGSRVQRPSVSQRKPCWWTSQATEPARCRPLGQRPGLPSRSGSPPASASPWSPGPSRAAARVVVLPAPAAPSTTTSGASPARAATTVALGHVEPGRGLGTASASSGGDVARLGEPGHDVGLDLEHVGEVRARTCSGSTRAGASSGTHALRARAVMSSASSMRTAGSRDQASARRSTARPRRGRRRRSRRTVGPRAGPGRCSTATSRSNAPTRARRGRSAVPAGRTGLGRGSRGRQLLVPGRHRARRRPGYDLVGAGVLPGSPVPAPAHSSGRAPAPGWAVRHSAS